MSELKMIKNRQLLMEQALSYGFDISPILESIEKDDDFYFISKCIEHGIDIMEFVEGNDLLMTIDQKKQIKRGWEFNIDTTLYARKHFNALEMSFLADLLILERDVTLYVENKLSYSQMIEIKNAQNSGLSEDILKRLAQSHLPCDLLRFVAQAFYQGQDILRYAEAGYSKEMLTLILEGLKNNLDISKFIKFKNLEVARYYYQFMLEKKYELLETIDLMELEEERILLFAKKHSLC